MVSTATEGLKMRENALLLKKIFDILIHWNEYYLTIFR